MGSRLVVAVCVAVSLAGCSRKADAPAGSTPPATTAATPGAPTPGTRVAGQLRNTGTPVDGPAKVTAPPTAGASTVIEVGWTGPGNDADYIDVAPRGRGDAGGEIGYVYTRDAMPFARLRMPTTPGDYDVRYIVDLGSEKKVKAAATVTVTSAAASVTAPPRVEGAEPLAVGWTGPSAEGDYIDIAAADNPTPGGEIIYAYTTAGNPASLVAPGKAGRYQVRYILEGPGGRQVLARVSLEVAQPAAVLTAPESVPPGAPIAVEWKGPKRKGDYIDLVTRGQTEPSGELSYFYADGRPSELRAPANAGEYAIRYVLEAPGGRVVLATRPIAVR